MANHEEKPSSIRRYVKYMVSLRCKVIVKSEIKKLGLPCALSTHGALESVDEISVNQFVKLNKRLMKSGMVLLGERESRMIDQIINTIIEIIHYTDEIPKRSFTQVIKEFAGVEEETVLKIFSDVMGVSILQFIVIQKIERAKELLLYDEYTLTQIADILNYKSETYLLAQFKKVTGLTPDYFTRLKSKRARIAEQHSRSTEVSFRK